MKRRTRSIGQKRSIYIKTPTKHQTVAFQNKPEAIKKNYISKKQNHETNDLIYHNNNTNEFRLTKNEQKSAENSHELSSEIHHNK